MEGWVRDGQDRSVRDGEVVQSIVAVGTREGIVIRPEQVKRAACRPIAQINHGGIAPRHGRVECRNVLPASRRAAQAKIGPPSGNLFRDENSPAKFIGNKQR